jgi:hypothetical protein
LQTAYGVYLLETREVWAPLLRNTFASLLVTAAVEMSVAKK